MYEKRVTPASWHSLSGEEVLSRLSASPKGLTQAEAQQRLKIHGYNRLAEANSHNVLIRFLRQFHNILIYVLLIAATTTALLGHWLDTLVILAVVIANAVIGFIQEGKADKAMDAIKEMLSPQASVLRDGKRMSIDGETLVPGDIVLLEAGDRVPADIRLLTAHALTVQEAILTGESVPTEKQTDNVAETVSLGDRSSMLYSGTLISTGQCTGVVAAAGEDAEIGRISGLIASVDTLTTPLLVQMDQFAKWLTALILLVSALLLTYGYFVGHADFTNIFMVVVGLAVAAIPEGLPAVLTITLAIGVQAMARRNAIVRKLPSIETLGSVSVICTDKTGTLTRNEMMVTSLVTAQHAFVLNGDGYRPEGVMTLAEAEVDPAEHAVLEELARTAVLCNDAQLQERDGVWVSEGDPMEGALLAFAGKMGLSITEEQAGWRRTDAIPFDARHRYMATLNHNHQHQAFVFVKGAPEQVLSMCAQQRNTDGSTSVLDTTYWREQAEQIAAMGQRVLALAIFPESPEHTVLEQDEISGAMILLGLVGLIDPPRPEAIAAIKECYLAGISVKMITGDHAQTAAAIGKQIGLMNTNKVLTGQDIDGLDDIALKQEVSQCDVFARASPEHKLRLVKALQANSMIVAMTGDGVNDAPALKRADTGIAMGKKGSAAAKEAADLVLADDNFASIIEAVREGRTVYDNIKKIITWTLPTNAGESLVIIFALLGGMVLPITAIQILWINLVTAATLGIALAFEPTEANTMRRPPRPRNEPLLNSTMSWYIAMIAVLFLSGVYGIYDYAMDRQYSQEMARTLVVNTLVVMEIFVLFFVRNLYSTSLTWQAVRGTKVIWLVVISITALQFLFTYFPPMQYVFGTEPVAFRDGVIIVVTGAVVFAICEMEKQLRLLLGKHRQPTIKGDGG